MKKQIIRLFICICLISTVLYGVARLYYEVTGGFHMANISSDFPYDPRWDTHSLSSEEKHTVDHALDQEYRYLGKGCQSYVFMSEDGKYVLKFFKYQRFRPQAYINWLSVIPKVEKIRQEKIEKKQKKLEVFFKSWKIAFDELPEETGLVYVHLNKTNQLGKILTIRDKIGLKHHVDLDQMEFLVQKSATMLCPTLEQMVSKHEIEESKQLLSRLVKMIVSEYHRGLADNDHALMQNTGVIDGRAIHIDVGLFSHDEAIKDPSRYHQELFNKTYKFRLWLQGVSPELLSHLDHELYHEMGDKFYSLKHIPRMKG